MRRWYWAHRDEYSKLRKKRYRSDPKRREKARKAAAQYRRERRAGLRVQRTLEREFHGVMVPVFSSGSVADRVGISTSVLRSWQARGWIPAPLFDEVHRLYTVRQVELIRLLADTVKAQSKFGVRRQEKDVVLREVIDVVRKTWKVNDHGNKGGKKARRGRR